MNQSTSQNRSLSGAGEAIEKTKNGAEALAGKAEAAFDDLAENARRILDDRMGPALDYANDAYDAVGEAFRAGEDYVRRQPLGAVTIAAVLGVAAGYYLATRPAPRRAPSRWF